MCRLAAASAGTDRDTDLPGGAGGDAGDNAAYFRSEGAGEVPVGDGMGGTEDTDNDVWVQVDSTVNKEAGECREGGSPAIATPTPTGREGELPFHL